MRLLCWAILNKSMREHHTYVNTINFTEGKAEANQLERLGLHGLLCWPFVLQLSPFDCFIIKLLISNRNKEAET